MFQHLEEKSQKGDYNQEVKAHAKLKYELCLLYAGHRSAISHNGDIDWVHTTGNFLMGSISRFNP